MPSPSSPLKLVHFRLIDAIARQGQLGRAAADCAMTQPAASRMLAEIEALVDARLFERRSTGMQPTQIGTAVARRARLMLHEMQDIGREIAELQSGRAGEVHIGAVTGAAVGCLVTAIARMRALQPLVAVHVEVAPSAALVARLLARDLDFVLGRIPHGVDPALFAASAPRPEHIRFVAHRTHPLARQAVVTAKMLAEWPWVVQPDGTPLRAALQQAFLDQGVALPQAIINTPSLMLAVAVLAQTDAIAPMAAEVADLLGVGGLHADVASLAIDTPMQVAPYALLTLRHRALSPAAMRMHDLVATLMAG